LFSRNSSGDLDDIALSCEIVSEGSGAYIYKKDTRGNYFYMVQSSEVEFIAGREDNSTCIIGRIGRRTFWREFLIDRQIQVTECPGCI